jgi:hypothetical protein
LLAVLTALALAPEARAHRLEGEHEVLPGRKVRVEAWFETGEPPQGARVRVYRPDGKELLAPPGEMDAQGVYVFSYAGWQPLRPGESLKVVISAGQGHRKELSIPARELEASAAPAGNSGGSAPPDANPSGPESTRPRERAYQFPVKDLLLGITFFLALGAFWLSLRNARRLRDLTRG